MCSSAGPLSLSTAPPHHWTSHACYWICVTPRILFWQMLSLLVASDRCFWTSHACSWKPKPRTNCKGESLPEKICALETELKICRCGLGFQYFWILFITSSSLALCRPVRQKLRLVPSPASRSPTLMSPALWCLCVVADLCPCPIAACKAPESQGPLQLCCGSMYQQHEDQWNISDHVASPSITHGNRG